MLEEIGSLPEITANPGSRDRVMRELEGWLRAMSPKTLDVVDPYFRSTDVELLLLVQKSAPDCQIRILTSRGDHTDPNEFRADVIKEWRLLESRRDPPSTVVYLVGRNSDGHMGIHDRWWLTENAGLIYGTSFSGLGRDKTSFINQMDASQVVARRAEVDPYLQLTKRSHAGEKLNYATIVL
jgi:hypothetical protein